QDIFTQGAKSASMQPALPVTPELIDREARRWPGDRITVRFLTPTRIVARGRLVRSAEFQPFFHRLLERTVELWTVYGDGAHPFDVVALRQQAASIECLVDETHWVDVESI